MSRPTAVAAPPVGPDELLDAIDRMTIAEVTAFAALLRRRPLCHACGGEGTIFDCGVCLRERSACPLCGGDGIERDPAWVGRAQRDLPVDEP